MDKKDAMYFFRIEIFIQSFYLISVCRRSDDHDKQTKGGLFPRPPGGLGCLFFHFVKALFNVAKKK